MKRTIITVAVTLIVVALAMIVGGYRLQPVGTSTAIAAPVPAALAVPMPASCPSIHEAIRALESARHDLEEARHDFCGHKHEAQEAVTTAIRQLRAAEGCAKCR